MEDEPPPPGFYTDNLHCHDAFMVSHKSRVVEEVEERVRCYETREPLVDTMQL